MASYNAETPCTQLVHDYANLIKDKVVLVTGVSPGTLGGHFVESIAKANPALLIIAARNPDKAQKTADEVRQQQQQQQQQQGAPEFRTLKLDLGSFQSVRQAADEVNGWKDVPAIDVVVNNAGIMAPSYVLTEDGFEFQLQTNYLGPFLFTNLIMDKVLASKSPRVVMVSSDGHRLSAFRFDDYKFDVWIYFIPLFIAYADQLGCSCRTERLTTDG